MPITVVEGDLLDQEVDAIVNPWNRNTIPWWLLLPQGVSGAIKRRGGVLPFKELQSVGRMKLGQAHETKAGNLPFRAIIHVSGINDFWRASETSIRLSVRNAVALAEKLELKSLAIPIIGAGSGSFKPDAAESLILDELKLIAASIDIRIVRYAPKRRVKSA